MQLGHAKEKVGLTVTNCERYIEYIKNNKPISKMHNYSAFNTM